MKIFAIFGAQEKKEEKINKKKKKMMSAQFKIAVHCAKFISNAIDNFYVNENLLTLTLSDVKFNQLKRSNKSFKNERKSHVLQAWISRLEVN